MKKRCPNLNCQTHLNVAGTDPRFGFIVRKGTYYRTSDRRKISRFQCKVCRRNFSSASFNSSYRQKRRDLNRKIEMLLCSGVSQRRLALLLRVDRKTVARKLIFLGHEARRSHSKWIKDLDTRELSQIQFDDLETSEHTKCKPLSVVLAVNKKSREILDFQVSRMPAKGHLSEVARKKYGYRKDERARGWNCLFKNLSTRLLAHSHFESDENPHYPRFIKRYFPDALHTAFPGARGAVAGQGELKKLKFDPLFSLNHTCAMLRANINRLFRRTWCTSKTIEGLTHHLYIYVKFHNQTLIPNQEQGKGPVRTRNPHFLKVQD